jgi:3-dehydroquinate dehydratase-1
MHVKYIIYKELPLYYNVVGRFKTAEKGIKMAESLIIKNKKIGEGRPLVCVPVVERDKAGCIREITYLAGSTADMIEWRVDCFDKFDDFNAVREVLAAVAPVLSDKIFLFTFRTKRQGGNAEIPDDMLSDLHDIAAESGCVDLVDVEYFAEEHPIKKIYRLKSQGVKVIASHHDFEQTPAPEVMQMILEQMCGGGADIVKLAVMPQNKKDVLNLLAVTSDFADENTDTPIITMAMGALGTISRVCGQTFGSCVTFGSHDKPSAPGQLDMNSLCNILNTLNDQH